MFEIKPGCQVYGRKGAYIGTVEAASADLLRVRAVPPVGAVYYVPTSAVLGVLPGGCEVFLDCLRDHLEEMGWLRPPHTTASADDHPGQDPMGWPIPRTSARRPPH